MTEELLAQLARKLFDLRHTEQIVPLVEVGIGEGSQPDDWRPKANWCHSNVDVWVARSPEYKTVRGWVVFNLSVIGAYKFASHPCAESTLRGRMIRRGNIMAKTKHPSSENHHEAAARHEGAAHHQRGVLQTKFPAQQHRTPSIDSE